MRAVNKRFGKAQPIMIHNHPAYFEVNYRGVKVHVEPASCAGDADGQWEFRFDHQQYGDDWHNMSVGCYPAVGIDVARAKAVELAKTERPYLIAQLNIERERIQKRLTELEAP